MSIAPFIIKKLVRGTAHIDTGLEDVITSGRTPDIFKKKITLESKRYPGTT